MLRSRFIERYWQALLMCLPGTQAIADTPPLYRINLLAPKTAQIRMRKNTPVSSIIERLGITQVKRGTRR